jgi:hypothetical protein
MLRLLHVGRGRLIEGSALHVDRPVVVSCSTRRRHVRVHLYREGILTIEVVLLQEIGTPGLARSVDALQEDLQ